MVENVFILGAGASFGAGAPLMGDFLDRADDLRRYKRDLIDADAFDEVFAVQNDLQRVHSKSFLHLDNIEALFGAIEMGNIIGQLGSRTDTAILNARESLVKLIVQTLEQSIRYPIKRVIVSGHQSNPNPNYQIEPTGAYQEFSKLLNAMMDVSSVITFNYDVALDFALFNAGYDIDYALADREQQVDNSIRLLKLHGSLNWARCPDCHRIYAYPMRRFLADSERPLYQEMDRLVSAGVNSMPLFISERLKPQLNCNVHNDGARVVESLPVIVPPTWNKTDYHGHLTRVWQQAARDLSTARNIYVIGYSLPESDAFFRYLYALGTIGQSRLQRFWVFNPDVLSSTQIRYEGLLGAGVQDRFRYYPEDFDWFVKNANTTGITEWRGARRYGEHHQTMI